MIASRASFRSYVRRRLVKKRYISRSLKKTASDFGESKISDPNSVSNDVRVVSSDLVGEIASGVSKRSQSDLRGRTYHDRLYDN